MAISAHRPFRFDYPAAIAGGGGPPPPPPPGSPNAGGPNGNGCSSCCRVIIRICKAVANFFIVIVKTIFAAIAWVFKALCCSCCTINHDDYDHELPNDIAHDMANVVAEHFRRHNEAQLRPIPEAEDLARFNINLNPQRFNALFHPLTTGYVGAVEDDGWQAIPAELLVEPNPISVNEVAAALPSPRIINPDMRARQVASLARLNEIKDSLNQNPRFDVLGSLIQFNCDQHLTPFAINTPVTRLGELLIYAGAETARPYNAADPRDSMYGHAQRVNVVQTEHMTRIDRFNQILQSHANGNYPGVAGDAAKRSLSQIFNILNAKKVRADQGHYNRDELKNEIRWVATCINDAHRNCIDQINAQLESIKLSVLVTELGNVAGLNTINIFGAHALFQYRANLLTEICQSQNRDEIHMVDMERIAKNELAEILNLGSRENVGAQYGWLIQNRVERIGAARDEFLRLYNEAPRAQEHDRRPLAYLVNGIKTSIPQAPLEKLRTKLLSWVQAHLRLELDATGLEYINEDVKAIVEAASEDPENDFLMGGDLSKAGILWLLESANIIR